jgi:hypothetical protein
MRHGHTHQVPDAPRLLLDGADGAAHTRPRDLQQGDPHTPEQTREPGELTTLGPAPDWARPSGPLRAQLDALADRGLIHRPPGRLLRISLLFVADQLAPLR